MFCAMCAYRILLIDIIRKALAADTSFHDEYERIQEAINFKKQLQLAVLASIPQHFHHRTQLTNNTDNSHPDALWSNFSSADYIPFRTAEHRAPELPFVRMAGGYMIQFPLFTAGAADPPGGKMREWVVGMLRLFGRVMGIRQGDVLAEMLEGGKGEGLVP